MIGSSRLAGPSGFVTSGVGRSRPHHPGLQRVQRRGSIGAASIRRRFQSRHQRQANVPARQSDQNVESFFIQEIDQGSVRAVTDQMTRHNFNKIQLFSSIGAQMM